MTKIYKNLIGGQEISLSGQTFEVSSLFFPDYQTKLANSNVFDIRSVVSKTKSSVQECQKLNFHDRYDILISAAKELSFTDKDVEYVVKMTGMPVTNVKKYLEEIPVILQHVPNLLKKRIGIYEGRIGHHPIEDEDFFKFLEPVHGFVYGVTPGNDPRVVPYVVTWLVTLGLAGIIKISCHDARISQLVLRKIVECGYPQNGLNTVCWDTTDPHRKNLNYVLVDSSKVVWAFGEDKTIDNLLRYETIEDENGKHKIDHFSDKIVLRHASGRAAGIVDERGTDLKKAAEIIIESSMGWPIGCNSMKALFDACDVHDELLGILKNRFDKLSKATGDPMNAKTKVGYSNPQHIETTLKRIKQL